MGGSIYIGISGWRYEPWRGVFYPEGLTQNRELEYASRQLPTIEINGSFYSLQRPESYAAWYAATPPGFVFSCKGNRFITHILRLHGDNELYASGYSDEALDRWAERIRAWTTGSQPDDAHLASAKAPPKRASRDLFCYFDNDIKVHAPFDARKLIEKLGLR
jgi:uncharacterized protein YecE (DUF72 family)